MGRISQEYVTLLLNVEGPVPNPRHIATAAFLLKQEGGLVAFPTETVYGLGANALNEDAILRIFSAKQRPADNPLIVHVASIDGLVSLTPAAHDGRVLRAAKAFWPGPLTLVLPALPALRRTVSRGLDTVAVRVPNHPVAQALLLAADLPIAAPSANLSGRPSPTQAHHVFKDLSGRIPLILDGGPCPVGIESTVLDLSGTDPVILRPGMVGIEELRAVLGDSVRFRQDGDEISRSPGTRYRHYAPNAQIVLVPLSCDDNYFFELAQKFRLKASGQPLGVLTSREAFCPEESDALVRFNCKDPQSLASRLYTALRDMDQAGCVYILADEMPAHGHWISVMERLRRAAGQ